MCCSRDDRSLIDKTNTVLGLSALYIDIGGFSSMSIQLQWQQCLPASSACALNSNHAVERLLHKAAVTNMYVTAFRLEMD